MDGSSDSKRAAWAAMVKENGCEPQFVTGTGRDVPLCICDRWSMRQALIHLNPILAGRDSQSVIVVTDLESNVISPVDPRPFRWVWVPRWHPFIRKLDRMANKLRLSIPTNSERTF
ncbi:MAG TPA: hypothetical protein VN809_14985 [Telmatospirillum sp.]|nr:hypothetical protein [Telmatospirillum sp.]